MGVCLCRLLKGHCNLTICSRSYPKARAAAKVLGINGSEVDKCAADCDILIAAVPTEDLQTFAKNVSRLMKEKSLFVDISSVKCGVIEPILSVLPAFVEYTSIHPLFASTKVSPKNMIYMQIRSPSMGSRFKWLLSVSGMRVTEATPEKHDKIMAAVQVLNHFAYLTLRNALRECDYGPSMEPFLTHAFSRTLASLKLIENNMDTIKLIQKLNKYAPHARNIFISEAKKLNDEFNKRN